MSRKLSRRNFLGLSAATGAGFVAVMSGARLSMADTATPAATPAPTMNATMAATMAATDSSLPPAPAAGPIDLKAAGGMDALVAAAQKEGTLAVITLPDDWSNYGEIKKNFLAKYNLKLSDLNPDGSSGDEIAAIKANAGNSGPQNPDVVDVGFIWGQLAKSANLFQPYKVSTWDTIPDALKDADGFY